jgi:hypothetical protein
MEQEKFGEALTKIAIAFDQIIDDYESRKKFRYGRSPFFFGDPLEYYNTDGEVKEFIEPMHEAMKILTLGLDYRRYVKFRLLVPELLRLRAYN